MGIATSMELLTSYPCFDDDTSNIFQYSSMNALLTLIANEIAPGESYNVGLLNSITDETFQTAGEMFFYLNLCPKSKFEWTQLLSSMLQNTSLDLILQTLNRIMVTGKLKNDKNLVDIAKKIFIRVGEKYPLHFQKFDVLTRNNSESEFIHGITNHNMTVDFGNNQ